MQRDRGSEESEIRNVINALADALSAKDVDGVLAQYSEHAVAFDLAPPLQNRGAAALRSSLAEWFPTWRGAIRCESYDLDIVASDDLALGRSLVHLTGTRTNGEKTDVWFRRTLGFQKLDGTWKITHQHESVPFYMDGSFRAALDLRP
jgi:ketosteroid isomerase-like protein